MMEYTLHPKFNEFCVLAHEIIDDFAGCGKDPDAVADALNVYGLRIAANNALMGYVLIQQEDEST